MRPFRCIHPISTRVHQRSKAAKVAPKRLAQQRTSGTSRSRHIAAAIAALGWRHVATVTGTTVAIRGDGGVGDDAVAAALFLAFALLVHFLEELIEVEGR
jgi:hypothetical protein